MLSPRLGKGLISALHDALGADVNPRPSGHLPVHHQALAIQFVEMLPGRPMRHEVGIGDQDPRRIHMGFHDGDGFARLHDQRLIRLQIAQPGADAVEILPGPRRPANAAVDHQFMRVFGHIGMQVVHQHPQGRLGQPGLGADLGAGGGVDVAGVMARIGHHGLTMWEGAAGRHPPARQRRSGGPRGSDRGLGSDPRPAGRCPAEAGQ